jgi:hypothetical protein
VTVADEVAGAASAVYWTNKGAVAVGTGAHRKMQEYGMRYQNWRHKGAGDEAERPSWQKGAVAAPTLEESAGTPAKKPRGQSWTTDEESFENTTTSHTTYTRKRTR